MDKVLALDLGLSFTGWSLFIDDNLVNCGCIHNPEQTNIKTKQLALFYKSQYLYTKLSELLVDTQVKSIVCEMPTGGSKSAIALAAMSMASSVLACLVKQYQLNLYKVTPRRVKSITCQNSKATKDDMMNQIRELYPSLPKIPKKYFEHIADSIGAFLTYKQNYFTEVPDVVTSD